MVFWKKLVVLVAGSGTAAAIGKGAVGKSTWYENQLSPSEYDQMFEMMKNVADVELNNSLDPDVAQQNRTKFIYSLFSTNLATFSEHFSTYFYRWALYQWATWILYETPSGSFPDLKQKLHSILSKFQYKPDRGPNGTPFDTEHWTKRNAIIGDSHVELGNAFTDFFFKELWKKSDNSDIGKEDSELEHYGHLEYAKAMVDFQKFVFDEWLAMQRPMLLCKKSWDFGTNISEGLYKTEKISLPDKPNFNFPDFKTKKDEVISFNKSGTCSDKTIFTTKDLSQMDGREIDALVTKYFDEINKSTDSSTDLQGNQYDDLNTDQNIYKIFTQDSAPNSANISQPNSELIDSSGNGDLKDYSSKHFLSWRKTKFGSNGSNYGTYVRTEKGLSFFYYDPNNADPTKKKLLSNADQYQLTTTLKTFFASNAGVLIGKYLSRQNLPLPAGVFGARSWGDEMYKLLEHFSLFSLELAKNKSHWETMVQLSASVKGYDKATFSSSKPDASSGLGLPLWLKRNLDKTTSVISNSSSFLSSLNHNNNGLFPLLQKYYDQNWKAETLNNHAQNLRSSLANFLKTIKDPIAITRSDGSSHNRTGYFLGDYIMDNVNGEFIKKEKGQFLKRATVSLLLANRMNFNFRRNDLSSLISRLISESKIGNADYQNTQALKELFLTSIRNLYYGKQYLNEPIEKRISYGGFKYTKPTKHCLRKTSLSVEDITVQKAPSNECSNDISNQKERSQKMEDYWLTKNYVFGSDGYELGSVSMSNHIKYLHSLYDMSLDGFKNMRHFITSNIPVGTYGALVWMDNVSNPQDSSNTDLAAKGDDNGVKNFEKYFRSSEMDRIFNPFFNRALTVEDTPKSNLSAGTMAAYAPNGQGSYVELFGFKGLYTQKLWANELPQNVAEAIFTKFKQSNPSDNKNYLGGDNSDVSKGIAFGESTGTSTFELEKRIDEFSTSTSLKNFLNAFLSSLVDEVWKEIDDGSGMTLNQIKQRVKDKLKDNKYSQQVQSALSRFSGLLQNPNLSNGMNSEKHFFIPTDEQESVGNVVYITQVNAHDFGGGFAGLINAIGTDAFVKMAVSLASQNKAMEQFTNSHLALRGIII